MKIKQVLIALDQLVNTLFNGYADETISARAYRQQLKKPHWKIARKIIDCIFFFQKDHCYKAFLSEKSRKHLPSNYSDN